jgi:hypothetical protein
LPKRIAQKTKPRWVPLWCQCRDCLETFSVEGLVNDGHIIKLEEHPRVGYSKNGDYYHRCGGNGRVKGRLMLIPVYPLLVTGGSNNGQR